MSFYFESSYSIPEFNETVLNETHIDKRSIDRRMVYDFIENKLER